MYLDSRCVTGDANTPQNCVRARERLNSKTDPTNPVTGAPEVFWSAGLDLHQPLSLVRECVAAYAYRARWVCYATASLPAIHRIVTSIAEGILSMVRRVPDGQRRPYGSFRKRAVYVH